MSSFIIQNEDMPMPNIQTFLNRPHINQLLEASVRKPLTMVVAGAGYGKTQAVYAFLREYDAVTIWLQLSPFDNLITRLWMKILHAISVKNKELAARLGKMGVPESSGSFDRIMDCVSASLDPEKNYVWVFDDLHLINDKAALQLFNVLLTTSIPNLSIILISRSEPDIDTARLLPKDLITYINEDVLRFTESEMIHYFVMQDIQLSSKALTNIYQYTQGWIFAINLVGLSLQKGLYHEDYVLDAAKANIDRLMESEVFSVTSKEMQLFLVTLSLIDYLPMELLHELFPQHNTLMKEMAQLNSFVRYDMFLNTYRIHHLFSNFLSEKQNMLSETKKRKIYTTAANWYANNGHFIDSITYYEKVNDYGAIIKIIFSSFPTMVPKETSIFLLGVLERASKAMRNSYAPDVLHTRFLLFTQRYDEALKEALALKEKYEARPISDEWNMVGIYVNIALVKFFTGSYAFKNYFKMAHDTGKKLMQKNFTFGIVNYACKVFNPAPGEFDRFIEAMVGSAPYMDATHQFWYGYEELAMAELAFFQKDLKNSEKLIGQAIQKAQQKRQFSIEHMAVYYLIRIKVSAGDYTAIDDLLQQLKLDVASQNESFFYTECDIITSWFYCSIGQIDKVAAWVKSDIGSEKEMQGHHFAWEQLARARCKLAKKKYVDALALLDTMDTPNGNEVLGRIEINILKAICYYRADELKQAIGALQTAYTLAAPNSLDMPFVEQGSNMRALISAAIQSGNCSIPMQWLEAIKTKSSTYAKKLSHIVTRANLSNALPERAIASFTTREIQVLTDLCHGLSREEISMNCGLSVNTVKSMLQNVYSKLGASNTLDAVRIAMTMDLVK